MSRPADPLPPDPAAWLVRLLTGICRQAGADLDRMAARPAQGIHALRVRMKKLRALLRLGEARLPAEVRRALRRRIRQVKAAFAASRDAEVLRELAARLQPPARPLQALNLPVAATPAPKPAAIRTARRRLAALQRELAGLDLAGLTREDLLEACVRQYRRCRRQWRRCRKQPDPEALHRWRRPVKELYYLSLALHRLPPAQALLRPARRLGRRLGQDHDAVLLEARLQGPDAEAWRAAIARHRRRLRRQIFQLAETLLARPSRHFRQALQKQLR